MCALVVRESESPAFWLGDDSLKFLYDGILGFGGDMRAVGGSVRDYLLGVSVGDIDLAVDLPPDVLCRVGESLGVRLGLHGYSHGTVVFILAGRGYEVTSLRRDVRTFGRRAEVEFGGDWESDSLRRDFTVNALSMDSEGRVYDYSGGLSDLTAAGGYPLIRYVGDAERRICEDYLRVLRLFRLYSRLSGSRLGERDLDYSVRYASRVSMLSAERRGDELLKLLGGCQAWLALSLMRDRGVLDSMGLFLPEVCDFPLDIDLDIDFRVCLYLLFLSGGRLGVANFFSDWRMNRRYRKLVLSALSVADFLREGEDLGYLLYGHGVFVVCLAIMLRYCLGESDLSCWHYARDWRVRDFPLDGRCVQESLGLRGAAVGEALDSALRYWLLRDCVPDRIGLLSYLRGER